MSFVGEYTINLKIQNNFEIPTSINDLAADVLSQIFTNAVHYIRIPFFKGYDTTNLDAFACVSKRWNKICNDTNTGPYAQLFRKQFSEYVGLKLYDESARESYREWIRMCHGEKERTLFNAIYCELDIFLPTLLGLTEMEKLIWRSNTDVACDGTSKDMKPESFPWPLGIAIYTQNPRSVGLLLNHPYVDTDHVAYDSDGDPMSALECATFDDCPYAKVIEILLKSDKVKLQFSEYLSDAEFGDILETFASILVTKQPQALMDMFDRDILERENLNPTQSFAKIVKTMGFQCFGNFYYHILSLARDDSIQDQIKRIRPSEPDIFGFSLVDIMCKYENMHFVSENLDRFSVDEIKRIVKSLIEKLLNEYNNNVKSDEKEFLFYDLFEKVLLRNDFDVSTIHRFCKEINDLTPHWSQFLYMMDRISKKIIKIKFYRGPKRPLELDPETKQPDQKKVKKEES